MKNSTTLPVELRKDEGKRWAQFLVALTVNIIVFATGFHTGWPAPSLPKLLSDEYPYDVTNSEASYITIMGHVGNLCGGLVGASLLDRIGRRKTILLIAAPLLTSIILIIASYQLMELLYVARFIGGIGESMSIGIIPLYTAEIGEPAIRGTLSISISVTLILGILCVNIVGSYLTIKVTALIFLMFPLLFLVFFWKMPESPYYLLMKGQHDEARTVLKFLRRKESVGEELSVLTDNVNRQMSESGSFRDVFAIDSNRKAFFLAAGARIIQQWTGIAAFSLYIQLLLGEATSSLAPHLGATIFLLVQLFMSLMTTFFVDKWGRKPLLLFSTGGCFVNLSLQAVYFGLKEHSSVDVSAIDWLPLVMMVLFIAVFTSGLGVVVTLLCGEIFSASIKSKAICLVNVVFALSMMTTTKFYQVTADNLGLTFPYSSFALSSLLGTTVFYFFLPETKGKSLEEIQQKLKRSRKEKKQRI